MHLTTGSVVDRYTVTGTLGEGGMAMVYRVRHNQLGTEHALKVLTIASAQIAERLLQEGRVQATLRHPNIVAVTDIVDLSGSPGLIMELVNGPSLDDFLVREPLSLDQVDALASGILAGVAAAHAQDLIHRDLKPANIMLAVTPLGLVPKVTDFGLAKFLTGGKGHSNTRTGSTMGTPHYMSPEQIRDAKNVGPRADVFSLGAILYEMVTQRRAFDGEDLLEIFNAVADGVFTPLRELRPSIPDRMERAIVGALKVDLADRIGSVAELQSVWSEGGIAAAPAVVVGPWDTEVMAKASSMSASADPVVDRPAGAQEPPATSRRPTAAIEDGSLVPVAPPTRDSLVTTRSLLIGVGSTAALLTLASGVALALAIGVGFVWSSANAPGEVTPSEVTPVEAPSAIEAGEPAPLPDPNPATVASPDPKPPKTTRPAARAGDVSAPPPAAEERSDAASPEAEPPPPDALESEAQPTPDPLADTDAVAEQLEPVDPDPVVTEPTVPDATPAPVPSGDPRAKLPVDLRSQSTSVRMDGLAMRESQADATWIYDIVVKHDPHSEVRKRAWKIVLARWRRGVGSSLEHQRVAVWMLGAGTSDQCLEAIDHIARYGTDVNLLGPPLNDSRSSIRRAAATGISELVPRTGQKVSARMLVEDRLSLEQDAKTIAKLQKALEGL